MWQLSTNTETYEGMCIYTIYNKTLLHKYNISSEFTKKR